MEPIKINDLFLNCEGLEFGPFPIDKVLCPACFQTAAGKVSIFYHCRKSVLCFSWNLDIFWKTICSVSKIVEVLFIIRDHWTSCPILDAFSVVADDRRCRGLASPRRRSSQASKGRSWAAALGARARSSAGGRSLPQATRAPRPLETPGKSLPLAPSCISIGGILTNEWLECKQW